MVDAAGDTPNATGALDLVGTTPSAAGYHAADANFAYLRLRKAEYSAKERKALEQRIARLADTGDVYVYFKHEDTPEGALHAEGLLSAARLPPSSS